MIIHSHARAARLSFSEKYILIRAISYYLQGVRGDYTVKTCHLLIVTTLLSLSLMVSSASSALNQTATISSTGNIANPGSGFSASLKIHQYTAYKSGITAQQYADYTDCFQIHYDASATVMQAIHSIDPGFLGLVYRNLRKVSTGAPEYSYFDSHGWILKDANGNYVYSTTYGTSYRMADIGNPDYQSWLADWVYNETIRHGYNGTFLDEGFKAYTYEIWWDSSATPINPRTGTSWTDQQVQDAIVSIYNEIRNRYGAGYVIVTNGILNGDRWQSRKSGYNYLFAHSDLNGVMGEMWWWNYQSPTWYSETSWKNSLNGLVELENTFIKGNNSKMFVPGCFVDLDGDNPLPTGCTVNQMTRFGFASTLLGLDSSSLYLALSNTLSRLALFQSSIFSLNIGSPKGSYQQVNGTHIYQRDFTNATVLVNPTNTAYTVALTGTYTNLDGNSVTGTITLQPQTGEVLTPS